MNVIPKVSPERPPVRVRVLNVRRGAVVEVFEKVGEDIDDGLIGRERGHVGMESPSRSKFRSEMEFEPSNHDG